MVVNVNPEFIISIGLLAYHFTGKPAGELGGYPLLINQGFIDPRLALMVVNTGGETWWDIPNHIIPPFPVLSSV